MTAFLPPNLLALFAPRDHLPFLPPLQDLPWEKKPWLYSGVAQYLQEFEDPSETPAPTRAETKEERRARKRQEREERYRSNLDEALTDWDPSNDPNATGDPFKTLFAGRFNYDTSESKIRREFESFGPIKKIHMVTDTKTAKPRGYAFIEYEHERDMRSAYKYGDGKKVDGRRVVVDVERGRTVKSWKPRRLGGGLGGTRKGAPNECIKYSGRVDERDMRDKDRDRERDRDRDRDFDREKKRERDRDRDRGDKGHDRDRDRDRRRGRSRSKERDRKRGRSRSRDRDKDKRDRSRSRDKKDKDRKRDKDRDKSSKDKDRHRDKDRDKDRHKDKDRERDKGREKVKVKSEEDEFLNKDVNENQEINGDNDVVVKEEPMEA